MDAMLEWMRRGLDAPHGCWSEPGVPIHVAWIAANGAQQAPPQPHWNGDRSLALVLTGEARLPRAGAKGSDPDRLLQAYDERGAAALAMLNGPFSGLLLDLRRGHALLFNDRYGLDRVYVHENRDGIFFATDVGAILRAVPSTRTFNTDSAAEFFTIGCTLRNLTLFRGIEVMPPGSVWTFSRDGGCRRARYFDPASWEQQETLPDAKFRAELVGTFAEILPEYLDDPAGAAMSLTGGLDSRMIMAWARPAPGTMSCYSFASMYRECEDVRLARQVAAACGQSFRVFEVGDAFLEAFPRLAAEAVRISGGAMDVTGASELYVNRLASQIAPSRVTGNYGSEILRGAVAFKPRAMAEDLCAADFRQSLARARETYDIERRMRDLSFIAFKQVPWHHHSRYAVERSELSVRTPYLDNRLVRLMYQAPAASIASKRPSFDVICAGNPALADIPTDRGLRAAAPTLGNRLHHAWLEFTFKAEYAYDYGMPQMVARVDQALRGLHIERLFLGRHKFQHYRIWYKNQLSGFVRDTLGSAAPEVDNLFQSGALKAMAEAHVRGQRNYTVELHRALTLELTARQMFASR